MSINSNDAGVQNLSDNGPDGCTIGASATELVSLYGATPIAQQTRPSLGLTAALAGGGCTYLGGAISYAMANGVAINAVITDLQDFGFYAAG
jgi:hypothetical protein